MGQEQHQFTNEKPQGPGVKKSIPAQYRICYDKWVADPTFVTHLLTENPTLTANILEFFPNARQSYEDFLEMVFYLRSYDPPIERRSPYVVYNLSNTTLLERFYMLLLKLNRFDQLVEIKVDREQMESLFLQFMKLFMPNPQKGFMNKLAKFIGFKEVHQTTLKHYLASLREFLPHIQKHIKDYYTAKFKDLQKDGHLLRHFKSEILHEDAILLSMKLAEVTSPTTTLLYEPRRCGMSFHSIQKQIIGYTGPWLLAIEHVEKGTDGAQNTYKFGAFQHGPIRDVTSFQGDVRGFLFQTEPKIKLYSTDKGTGGNHYYCINGVEDLSGKTRMGIGFGGNEFKENFKLWIDRDIDKSTVFNGHDTTYGFGALVNPTTTNLNITKIEIWGLGTHEDLKNQVEYWQSRQAEIQKRRKVDRKQFMQGDTGMMFSNTFAHREQVYGTIERTEKERMESEQYKAQKHEQQQQRVREASEPQLYKKSSQQGPH